MKLQEDYCSYEVARLLKEKGFDGPCRYAYHNWKTKPQFHRHQRNFNGEEYCKLKYDWYSAPTHQMAMKWLREKGIDIFLSTDYPIDRMKYTYKVVIPSEDGDKQTDCLGGSYDTYEQAVEAALLYTLQNLI